MVQRIIFFYCCIIFQIIVYVHPAFSKESYGINHKTVMLLKKADKERKDISSAKDRSYSFYKGEILTYKVTYINMIDAGKAILSASSGYYKGKKVIVLGAQAYSAKWFSFLYRVHNATTSFFSPKRCYPYFLIMKKHEGSHNDFMEERLNGSYEHLIKTDEYKTAWKRLKNGKFLKMLGSNGKYNKPALYKDKINAPWKAFLSFNDTQDALSALYYLRLINLKEGKNYYIPVYENRKRYIVLIKAEGYYNIDTPAGKFNTIKVKAFLNFNGIFSHKGSLEIYFSTGANHTPVYLVTNVRIGFMTAILTKKKVF